MVQDGKGIAESQNSESPHFPVWRAVIAGWLLVNVPVLVIILSVFVIGVSLEPKIWWLSLAIASFLGWIWWSFTVPRWRHWALNRGANPDKLQRWAVITGLVWRKGSIFEKTEFRNDD
jgi:hypothetical protein